MRIAYKMGDKIEVVPLKKSYKERLNELASYIINRNDKNLKLKKK